MKREDYINWDEYFMGVAMLSAKRSKDPSTQVGAVLLITKTALCRLAITECQRAVQTKLSLGTV